MTNKKKFEIIYQKFAKPIFDMAMTYESSALTIENNVVDKRVVVAFNTLKQALENQLNNLR